MSHTRTRSLVNSRSKVSKTSTSKKDRQQQQHCFITWTDWRAFQPARDQVKTKQDGPPTASSTLATPCERIEGWHPEDFANRYRRASYPRLVPMSTKNLNILNSQRINSWERDFLSDLLLPERTPVVAAEQHHLRPIDEIEQTSEPQDSDSIEVPDPMADDAKFLEALQSPDHYFESDSSRTLDSTPGFTFETCLAEVEQIVCDSIKNLPNMFDSPDRLESNVTS